MSFPIRRIAQIGQAAIGIDPQTNKGWPSTIMGIAFLIVGLTLILSEKDPVSGGICITTAAALAHGRKITETLTKKEQK